MKEKTLYSYIEYDDCGGNVITVFAKEDGKISYRFYGWKNKRKRKYVVKSQKRSRQRFNQKIIVLFSGNAERNYYSIRLNVNSLDEIGESYFVFIEGDTIREYIAKRYRFHPEIHARQLAKRKRHLGYFLLNKFVPEYHGHHINKTNVLYIPADLHRSVPHNVFTGKGMKEINDLAFQWIATQENIEGLNALNRKGDFLINGKNNNKNVER